jgi:O-antigen ligase/polysaccharide polymerase Wzy-like membrane protein
MQRRAAIFVIALIPGVLTAYFSFESGGYFAGAPALVAAELLVLIALWLALARRPLDGAGRGVLLAAAALGAFAVWILLSGTWSDAPARAIPEYTRALGYLAALVFFGLLPFSAQRVRLMAYGVAAAIVVVCAAAFLSRTVPDAVSGLGELQSGRLSYPLDYWNSLGLLAGLGIVLCGHFACASRDHWASRVLGAAAIPLLTATLYYTFSRGATWATLVGIGLYAVLARPRGLLAGALATVPPTVVALMTVNPADVLTSSPRFAADTLATGHRTALIVFACVVAAGAVRACLLPVDGRLEALGTAPRLRRRALAAAGVAGLLVVLVASAALHVPTVVADKYDDFKSGSGAVGDSGSSRLLSSSDNGRLEHWEVALDAFRHDRLHGSGAGTYQIRWARERPSTVDVRDGHSLYLETLGELGIVGLALLCACLLVVLGGFARRVRGDDRELFAALLAAGVAWAIAAGVDWVWEMPAVTLWLFALGGAALARPAREAAGGPRSGRRRVGNIVLRGAAVGACGLLALLPARLAVSQAHVETAVKSMHAGDCHRARSEARRALELVEHRAAPHHVMAWCLLAEERPGAAARELDQALEQDPDSWILLDAAAVARAAARLDSRAVAKRALEQNPKSALTQELWVAASRNSARARARAVRRLSIPVPEIGDP